MNCEKCGEMNVDSAPLCARCGEPFAVIQESSPIPPPINSRRRVRPVRIGILVALLLVIVTGGVGAYQYWLGVPILETLIPANSVGYGCSDARWLFDNTVDIREEPKVAQGIAEAEKQLGISLDKDIIPWAGNVAVAVLDAGDSRFNAAVYIQVKDQRRFQATVQRLRTMAEERSGITWGTASYKGVEIRTTDVDVGMNTPLKVSSFWTKGWIVIALGDTAANRVIDTWQKTTPSLAQDARWAKALNHLPSTRISWFGIDTRAIHSIQAPGIAQLEMLPRTGLITVAATSSNPTGFRVDSYVMPTSPESTAAMRNIAGKIKPLTGNLYARLPDGTFTTIMVSGTPALADYFKKSVIESADKPEQRDAIRKAISEIDGLQSAIHRIKGDTGAAASWQPGKGFGVTVIADMGSPASAVQASTELAAFVAKKGAKLTRVAPNRFAINGPAGDDKYFRISPVWETSGRYITMATNPVWLKPGTSVHRLQMPVEAKGACMLSQGDFRPMTSIVADLTQSAQPRDAAMINGIAEDTRLASARWAVWSSNNADGSTRGVAYISNWQWHEAMKDIIKRIDDTSAQQ